MYVLKNVGSPLSTTDSLLVQGLLTLFNPWSSTIVSCIEVPCIDDCKNVTFDWQGNALALYDLQGMKCAFNNLQKPPSGASHHFALH